MRLDSSLGEAFSVLRSFFENRMSDLYPSQSSSLSMQISPSKTLSIENKVQDQSALITPAPELRLRNPAPEPQNGDDCSSQASRSASQAIQQASQQASESIRQASQSASQAAQQASQSASQGIRQAENSASQSIAAASRSVSSISSSASSAVSSVQSSAEQAISRANRSMRSAQAEASEAVLQAGAAVAAATGSAAAAGSSFLSVAAKATQGAEASLSAIGAASSSQAADASQQVSASQTVAVTATQAALAIVGSIIASTLITILIYFLVIRHKKVAQRHSRSRKGSWPPQSPKEGYSSEPKFTHSDQVGTTMAASQKSYDKSKKSRRTSSDVSLSMFPKTPNSERPSPTRSPALKTTSIPWNPSKPPTPPTLGSWLKVQDTVSPFGSIKLPMDDDGDAPLGGQLKSPHRSTNHPQTPRYVSDLPLRAPRILVMEEAKSTAQKAPKSPSTRNLPVKSKTKASPPYLPSPLARKYREAKATVWTDGDSATASPAPSKTSPPQTKSLLVAQGSTMKIPSPNKRVRTSAEWLAFREELKTPDTPGNSQPPITITRKSGLSSKPWPNRERSITEEEEGHDQDSEKSPYRNRESTYSGVGSRKSQMSTPGVGKAV